MTARCLARGLQAPHSSGGTCLGPPVTSYIQSKPLCWVPHHKTLFSAKVLQLAFYFSPVFSSQFGIGSIQWVLEPGSPVPLHSPAWRQGAAVPPWPHPSDLWMEECLPGDSIISTLLWDKEWGERVARPLGTAHSTLGCFVPSCSQGWCLLVGGCSSPQALSHPGRNLLDVGVVTGRAQQGWALRERGLG